MRKLFFDLARIFLRAQLVDEDLDPRLVFVVAPSVAIVDAQTRLGIGDQLIERHKIADARRNHRGAAHAAANVKRRADLARLVLHNLDADIMQAHRCTVCLGCDNSDFEFAWQIHEFGMEARPLAQQLGIGARVNQLVARGSCEMIGRDIADAIAAGLDGVHLDRCKVCQQVACFFQLDPIVLDILARGEMAITTVIFVRDIRQSMHLCGVQRAIGDRHAQHIGVELQIEPVHQPQWLELVFRKLAFQPPLGRIAKLSHACVDHLLVVIVIFVHVRSPNCRHQGRRVLRLGQGAQWARARARGP